MHRPGDGVDLRGVQALHRRLHVGQGHPGHRARRGKSRAGTHAPEVLPGAGQIVQPAPSTAVAKNRSKSISTPRMSVTPHRLPAWWLPTRSSRYTSRSVCRTLTTPTRQARWRSGGRAPPRIAVRAERLLASSRLRAALRASDGSNASAHPWPARTHRRHRPGDERPRCMRSTTSTSSAKTVFQALRLAALVAS